MEKVEEPKETTRLLARHEEQLEEEADDEADGEGFVAHILKYKTYDYLIYMAVLTIFLCLPLGIIALLFALKAHSDAQAGNYTKAKRESWTVWVIVSLAILIDVLIVVIVLVIKTT